MSEENTNNDEVIDVEASEEQTKRIGLDEATVEQLKVAAFDLDQNIRTLQTQYQAVIGELQKRNNQGS